MAQIYDGFMYAGEHECLAIRLHELAPLDVKFIIVEARETFQGTPRELSFPKRRDIWEPYKDRIIYTVIDRFRGVSDPWDREAQQRNTMSAVLRDAAPDALCLFSDADEIPKREDVALLAATMEADRFMRLGGPHFHYFLNLRVTTYPQWYGPHVCRREYLSNPGITVQRMRGNAQGHTHHVGDFTDAAWHFSFLGSASRAVEKLRSWSHTEDEQYANWKHLAEAITQQRDWKTDRRPQLTLEPVPVDETFPHLVRERPETLATLFVPWEKPIGFPGQFRHTLYTENAAAEETDACSPSLPSSSTTPMSSSSE